MLSVLTSPAPVWGAAAPYRHLNSDISFSSGPFGDCKSLLGSSGGRRLGLLLGLPEMGEMSKQVRVDNWGVFFLQRLQSFFNKTDYCDLTLQFEGNVQLKVSSLNEVIFVVCKRSPRVFLCVMLSRFFHFLVKLNFCD